MLKTNDLIEFLTHINPRNAGLNDEDVEKINIIICRLKDFDALKQGIDHLHSDMIAGELFENET